MFVDEAPIRQSLARIIRKMTANGALREDLLQEALIHLWLTELARPAQTRSWYMQSCRYHLMHYLAAGRSVDSTKRRAGQLHFAEDSEECDWLLNDDSGASVFGWVSARDIMSLLTPHLHAQERAVLECFADGLRVREIGRKLDISHTMVIRHRRKIASLLKRLETPGTRQTVTAKQNGFSRDLTLLDSGAFLPPELPSINLVSQRLAG